MENIIESFEEPPSSWRWQIQNSITTKEELEKHVKLTEEEKKFFEVENNHIKLRITPYYLDVIKKNPILRKCVIPQISGLEKDVHEEEDSLNEESDSPIPNLVHRYPDRALLLVTDFCSSACQYCTRSRIINKGKGKLNIDKAIEYINEHTEVRDVIISGGDPFTLSNQQLDSILSKLHFISHVEVIRIGTKVPVVLPQRFEDKDLISILEKYWNKLWINIHFSHPAELTIETKRVCLMLTKLGIPIGSQTVLLKGVNDNIDVMKELMQKLLTCKVRPYYLYQMDQVVGGKYFQTPIQTGLDIIKGLRGWTSGLGVPHFVIDAPGGGGKIPLLPNYVDKENFEKIVLKNYKGNIYEYWR